MTEHEYDVLVERIYRIEKAIELQAIELSRRLYELNHEHAKRIEDQARFVTNEKFDGSVSETLSWRAAVQKTLTLLEGKSLGITSARGMLFQILPLLLSIAAFVLMLWKRPGHDV